MNNSFSPKFGIYQSLCYANDNCTESVKLRSLTLDASLDPEFNQLSHLETILIAILLIIVVLSKMIALLFWNNRRLKYRSIPIITAEDLPTSINR